jgi:hypothetical protein
MNRIGGIFVNWLDGVVVGMVIGCIGLHAKADTQGQSDVGVMGYNAPALVLEGSSWFGFVQTSFLYWHCNEDGLSMGRQIPANRTGTAPTLNEQILYPDFQYKPGFKLATGVFSSVMDHWLITGEWTRLHQKTHQHYGFDGTTKAVLLESWVHLLNTSFLANQVDAEWKLHFDCFDFTLSRPYDSGKWLVLIPTLGLRTVWIDQDFFVTYQFTNTTPMVGDFESNSWGIGPLVGCSSRWSLGQSGVGLIGRADASIFYAKYTKLFLHETIRSSSFAASDVNADYGPYRTIRTSTGAGIGLDWTRFFQQQRYNVYLSLLYDFNLFWNQNMLRGISDNYSFGGSEQGTGSLHFHGLTLKGRFSF